MEFLPSIILHVEFDLKKKFKEKKNKKIIQKILAQNFKKKLFENKKIIRIYFNQFKKKKNTS